MTADVETVVVGAGVVGLAVACALAGTGHEVTVLEQHAAIGSETSSRNSEVIHAGIYYPPGSLKAVLCVRGKELIYRFCAENGVAHARCGKLLVATHDSQLPKLAAIRETAAKNGVTDLEPVGASAARALEPELDCVAALISPSTGIVDSHGLMLALEGHIEPAAAPWC
jgi:L-2-hydroxyglutarate oxidase LhgO